MSYRFNTPPGWPRPPQGWRPPEGWQPDPAWPPAPPGWEFWVAEAPGGQDAPGSYEAPAAPAVDDDAAEADATEAERAAGAPEVEDVGEHGAGEAPAAEPVDPPTEEFMAEPPTEQFPAQQPTEQFPAQQPTQQFPVQQQAGGWGGVPQQPGPQVAPPPAAAQAPGAGLGSPQAPAPQGPAASAPAQPQWGTAPPSEGHPAGGYQPAGPQQPTGGYSAAPPPGSGPQFGGLFDGQQPQQAGPFDPGDAPAKKSRTPLIIGGIAAAVILVLAIVLGVRLIGGGDDEAGGPDPSPTAPATPDATDDDPASTDPAHDDPASTDPADDDPAAGGSAGDMVTLQPGEAGEVLGITGDPELTVAVLSVERNWEPEGTQAVICGEPNYEYIAVELEFTTLPSLADGSGTYTFAGFELGLATEQGTPLDASGIDGLFCLSQDQQAPSDMAPDQTYTGWAVIDASPEAASITWNPFLDVTSQQPVYVWNLADF